MMVDISHVSIGTMRDVLNVSQAPVIFSHSGAFSVCNHTRNVQDEILLRLVNYFWDLDDGLRDFCSDFYIDRPFLIRFTFRSFRVVLQVENRGIVMVVFYNDFVSCAPNAALQDVVSHIQHIRKVTGSADYIGIGSDFNGVTRLIFLI